MLLMNKILNLAAKNYWFVYTKLAYYAKVIDYLKHLPCLYLDSLRGSKHFVKYVDIFYQVYCVLEETL